MARARAGEVQAVRPAAEVMTKQLLPYFVGVSTRPSRT